MAWIQLNARGAIGAPTLTIVTEGGEEIAFSLDRDSSLVAYLPDRNLGGLPDLAIDRRDKNHVILHFPVPIGLKIDRAILSAVVRVGQTAPKYPFPVAAHKVLGDWSESKVTWANAPEHEVTPTSHAVLPVGEKQLTLDLTEIAKEWTKQASSNHGLLLRTAVPLTSNRQQVPSGQQRVSLDQQLVDMYDWATDLDAALREAKQTRRKVLAFVTADFGDPLITEQERVLLATVFCHPAIRQTIREQFVIVRVRINPNRLAIRLNSDSKPADGSLLDPVEFRPPALVVISAKGRVLKKRTRLGPLNAGEVLRWLGSKTRLPKVSALKSAAHLYELAARMPGDTIQAPLAEIQEQFPDTEWAFKARIRQELPSLVANYELQTALKVTGESRVLKAATEYLLKVQLVDGSFPMGHPLQEEHREGISALCSLALHQRGHTEQATKGTHWLETRLGSHAPRNVNSFTATYFLDLQMHRYASGEANAEEVQRAIQFLVAGQLSNGAWSYSKRFGEDWKGGFSGWPKTNLGRAHSINTAIALEALTRAKRAGLTVEDKVLKQGKAALLAMRTGPGQYAYTYPGPRKFDSLDASIAKAPAAELALLRLEAVSRSDLKMAIDAFMKSREALDIPRKLTDVWLPPNALSGYFHSCAYFHAAQAIREFGGPTNRKHLADLRKDLLRKAEPDGTWMDTITLGRAYATAMAILVMDRGPKAK
ncbi:MAG: DNRLRE domain-containing protein [bacterium]|nr:DNRLRE domain-containing protein [bacterium]